MEVKLPNSGKVVKQFKNDLTATLDNIHKNCNVILEFHTNNDILNSVKELQKEILDIIDWYSRISNKQGVLDYLRDYGLIDRRFNNILEILPETFDYYLCLIESRFKLTYKEKK
jgi:hypothetical protein